MKRVLAGTSIRVWLLGVALLLDLLVLRAQIDVATESAACLERAKVEMISCLLPPSVWQVALPAALAVVLAVSLGALIVEGRRHRF
jgi:hypothetical protein